MKTLIINGILGTSIAQVLFDIVVLQLKYGYPKQNETPEQMKRRVKCRYLTGMAIPVANIIGFYIARHWTRYLMSLNSWISMILLTIHSFTMFSCWMGYIMNLGACIRYFRTGRSRFNTGIMDEVSENSNVAVLDFSRFSFVKFGFTIASPFYIITGIQKLLSLYK